MVEASLRWTVRELNASLDVGAVAALSLACADYALLINGEPPRAEDGIGFFTDVAPGKKAGDMLKQGVFGGDGSLAGVVDAVRSYPTVDARYIGLLLLHPEARGRGAGRLAVGRIHHAALDAGASRLMVSVVEENGAALAFWRRLGFAEVRRLEPRRFGHETHARIELARTVGPSRVRGPAWRRAPRPARA